MNYLLSGTEELVEITLERISDRKRRELDGKMRQPSKSDIKRAAIRRELERRREAKMVDREMAEVWDV